MKVYVEELNKQEFLDYAMSRKAKSVNADSSHNHGYNHVTKERLEIVFDFYSKWKMKSEGPRQNVSVNGEWFSELSEPDKSVDNFESHKANLFHEMYCQTEWAGRLSDYNEILNGQRLVRNHFGYKVGTEIINAKQERKIKLCQIL